MAASYFENVDFYRDLVARSASEVDGSAAPTAPSAPANHNSDTTICARIRPLSAEEFESRQISGIVAKGSSKAVLFEPRKKFNGALDAIKHEFSLDQVYDGDTQTETLYQDVGQELVPWIWAGGVGTLFAYGQTGSGKTFTVTGITNMVVKDMMAMAEVEDRELHICCFEILGKRAYDLLDNRRTFSILEDSFGTMQLVGVKELHPKSEEEFLSIIKTSSLLRSSAPTAKNDQSSRSHAVHRIRAVNKSDPEKVDGELFLVDLAGSEGSKDSQNHAAERFAETKDINTSLSILKDCIRGRTLWGLQQLQPTPFKKGSIHVPWRSSKLTQVLKHVFGTQAERACKTLVVACVAPSIVDSAHSKNTLRYAEMLRVPMPKAKGQKNPKNPSGWTNDQTKKWIIANSGTPPIDATLLAGNLTGLQLCKLPQKDFVARCLQTPSIPPSQAIAFYQKLWRLQIDSRQEAPVASSVAKSEPAPEPAAVRDTMPFQRRIRQGMFVRIQPGPGSSRWEGVDFVMVMSPLGPEDFAVEGDERRFVCALVGPSPMTDAYELAVSRLETYSVREMVAEVLMEYDQATRYYYMNL